MTKFTQKKLAEWAKVRTDAITEMFNHPDESGIYPTTKFFNTIDSWLTTALEEAQAEQREADAKVVEKAIIIGEEDEQKLRKIAAAIRKGKL